MCVTCIKVKSVSCNHVLNTPMCMLMQVVRTDVCSICVYVCAYILM